MSSGPHSTHRWKQTAALFFSREGDRAYVGALVLAALFTVMHLAALPLRISYDGLGYIDQTDILFSSRFPHDWPTFRTPLYPAVLKAGFLLFGRQAMAAMLVSTAAAFAGIWLLGASARRLAGPWAAAATVLLMSIYPTLVAYQHSVLTETGTFFFLAAIVYLLVTDAPTVGGSVRKALALMALLGLGYYWRSNVLLLAPLVGILYIAGGWNARSRRWLRVALAVVIVAGAMICARFWSPYAHNDRMQDVTLRQGMLRQALLPPDHPVVGDAAPEYQAAIEKASRSGNFYSGVADGDLLILLPKIFPPTYQGNTRRLFLELIRTDPGRYLAGVGRTLLLCAGVEGQESDNRTGREDVLTAGSKISNGPEPLRRRIVAQFQGPEVNSILMRRLQRLAPWYDGWVILSHLIALACLVVALFRRDLALLTCAALPLAYTTSYSVLLSSVDRYAFPTYPILLALSIVGPVRLWQQLSARRRHRLAASSLAPAKNTGDRVTGT